MIWLRSAFYAVWFWSVFVVMALVGQMLPQAWLAGYSRLWCRLVMGGLWLAGIRVAVSGLENLPPGPALIASQHQSEFDTIFWLGQLPRCRYVVKAELLRVPLFGRLMRRGGHIAVDRKAGAQAMRQLLRQGGQALAEGRQLVIFPEGTRVKLGHDVALQPGVAALAAQARCSVVPVATDSGRCWPGKSFLRRPGVIHVDIRPALPAGLDRGAMLAGLAAAYRTSPLHGGSRPVENSVGDASNELS